MQMSLRQKGVIILATTVVTLGSVIFGALSNLERVSERLETNNREILPWVEALGEIETSLAVAHAESVRLILLYMSGVKGAPADRQAAILAQSGDRAEAAIQKAQLLVADRKWETSDAIQPGAEISELLDRYTSQRQVALDIAVIDPSTGRLLYTAADNTFAELISIVRSAVDMSREQALQDGQLAEAESLAAIEFFKLAALAGAMLTALITISLIRSIVRPLTHMTTTMQRLSKDDLEVEIASRERRDELGAMARALEVFRMNVLERQRLEARNKILAAQEAERKEAQQRAKQQQKAEEDRLRMTAQLRQEFGEVIGAANLGDFSKRITAKFADSNLDALSSDINRLVETMHAGVSSAQRAIRALARGERHEGARNRFAGAFADMMENIKDTSQQIQHNAQKLRHSALHDALTGLPNRRFLEEHLAEEKKKAEGHECYAALLHVDLDRFKQINDTLGHAAGDDVLRQCATLLKEASGPDDFVARIGGDEFVIFRAIECPSLDEQEALRHHADIVAAKVVTLLANPIWYDSKPVRSGASVGVAFSQLKDLDPADLLINADLALYEAKENGRNQVHHFTPNLHTEAIERRELGDDIVRGLAADEFVPYFQPQVDVFSHDLCGFEALARWHHPKRGVLSPFHFLRTAEQIGVLPELDRNIMLKSAAAMDRMRKNHGINIPRLSLNLGLTQIQDEGTLAIVDQIKSPHYKLCVELLESVFFEELTESETWLIDGLIEKGVELELDDFGSGHASISSLISLRPERLKIDRSIIMPLTTLPHQRQLVQAIIQMAQSLEIGVIAEGVETLEHAKILADLNCCMLQGFAFAPALPEDEAVLFATRGSEKVSA